MREFNEKLDTEPRTEPGRQSRNFHGRRRQEGVLIIREICVQRRRIACRESKTEPFA